MTKPIFLLLMGFLLSSSWSCPSTALGRNMILVKKQDSGKRIEVNVGTIIQVELEQPGATGSLWQIDHLDEEFLELEKTDSKGGEQPGKTGAPITKYWIFKAKKKGKTQLTLLLYRPWKGKDSSVERFTIAIAIE